MLEKIEGRRRRGMTEDEMVGWHHRLYGHEFEQAMGDGEGQGSQVCCSSWSYKELDMTEQLNNNNGESRCSFLWETQRCFFCIFLERLCSLHLVLCF